MTDVVLENTSDGGEITITNGLFTMGDGLGAAVYLSLFGGNVEDGGADGDKPVQWWGNWSETEASHQYRSETQHLLKSLPLIPASLRRIEDAVTRDTAWMVPTPASAIAVVVTMPALNTVKIQIDVTVNGKVFQFIYVETGV